MKKKEVESCHNCISYGCLECPYFPDEPEVECCEQWKGECK